MSIGTTGVDEPWFGIDHPDRTSGANAVETMYFVFSFVLRQSLFCNQGREPSHIKECLTFGVLPSSIAKKGNCSACCCELLHHAKLAMMGVWRFTGGIMLAVTIIDLIPQGQACRAPRHLQCGALLGAGLMMLALSWTQIT